MKNDIDRREFVSKTARIAVAISMPVFVSCKDDNNNAPEPVTPPKKEDCNTTVDILGPFYKPDAPFREDIIPPENTALPLIVQGKVFGDCETALKDAVAEIWNANAEGEYDNTTFKFRGRYKTGQDGSYRFKTIVPGRYLNGAEYRPSHIHFQITAPGYQVLVSQIYFKDDPFIASDPWASDPKASERILTIESDNSGIDMVTFDIYLIRLA